MTVSERDKTYGRPSTFNPSQSTCPSLETEFFFEILKEIFLFSYLAITMEIPSTLLTCFG